MFEQKYEKLSEFLSENFQFLEVKFSTAEAVLRNTHNLCFEQKRKSFLYENFQFLEVKFSIYLNRRGFVMMNIRGWDRG